MSTTKPFKFLLFYPEFSQEFHDIKLFCIVIILIKNVNMNVRLRLYNYQ